MPGRDLDKNWSPKHDCIWQLGRERGFKQGVAVGVTAMLVLGVMIVLFLYTAMMNT